MGVPYEQHLWQSIYPLEQFEKLDPCDVCIRQDLGQQAWADGLSSVNGDYGSPTIRVAEKHVASPLAYRFKTGLRKCADYLLAGKRGKSSHTAIR